jgi:transglutaminase-like putative cysteine protease
MSSSSYFVNDVESSLVGRDYLDPSAFCDSNHPRIRALARQLTAECSTDEEKVAAVLRWVRNGIGHRALPYPQAASDTLACRSGSCSNRANLLVALLRALGIPAGFHLLKMEVKDCFGLLESPVFHPFPAEDSFHLFCAVLLGEKWVKCDSTKWHVLLASPMSES